MPVPNRADTSYATGFSRRVTRTNRTLLLVLAAEWPVLVAAAGIAASPSRFSAAPWLLVSAASFGPGVLLPAFLLHRRLPTARATRLFIALSQIIVSVLAFAMTGGEFATRFEVFGSLALIAWYRDPLVLIAASAVALASERLGGPFHGAGIRGLWMAIEDGLLLLSMRRDAEESRLTAAQAVHLQDDARRDVLTGLGNRRYLQDRFEQIVEHSVLQCGPSPRLALLFIDLNHFKHANDTLGHAVGDRLLALVAARFSRQVSADMTLARVGGDEFVILVDRPQSIDTVMAFGCQLLDSLIPAFHIDEHRLSISASVGISLFPEHSDNLPTLQEQADLAMYLAKSRGGNQCVLFSDDVSNRRQMLQELANDLANAMQHGEFQLFFQPIMQRAGRLSGFEALLRWRHPRYGDIPPADFIPLAEQSGLILTLGDWVLAEACRACLAWQKPGRTPLGVAVNISPLQFSQPDYADRLGAVLAEAQLDPSLLTIEITEGSLVRDAAAAQSLLSRVRRTGVRIALDDFGTGYSSLSYLTDLPADIIKLDRAFLNRRSGSSLIVIDSVIALAHRLGMQVVAEGIESEAQQKLLMDLRCDEFQGYYISAPVPLVKVNHLIERYSAGPAWNEEIHALALSVASQPHGVPEYSYPTPEAHSASAEIPRPRPRKEKAPPRGACADNSGSAGIPASRCAVNTEGP